MTDSRAGQANIFISYQRADEPFARRVREHLVAHGVTTWMDQYDIPVGAYWPDEIDRGLGASDIVVGILSPDAIDSRNVKNEWDWALQRDKPLLLLMTRPTEIPHRYVSINYIDAVTSDPARALDALLQRLGVSAGVVSEQAPLPVRHSARRTARRHPAPPVLVGREREQAVMQELLDDTLAGRGRLALVAGEAGIGKTTLTNWLGWASEEAGALALSGSCLDVSTARPYGPWVGLFRAWPDSLPRLPVELHEGSELGAIRSQAGLFDLVEDTLLQAAETRPLLLLLEDFHWADVASLDLLRHLARTVGNARLLLVVTYRDDELTRRHPLFQLLPGLAREPAARRIALHRLDTSGVEKLIAARYDLPDADAGRLVEYVERLTEGNPFFAGEVLSALEEAGALLRDTDGWRVERLERVQVPALVRQVIDARLERLGDEARRQLEAAAVLGYEAPIDLWVEVSGADEMLLSRTLEAAVDARLIEELRGGERFRFTHALIRETLYEGMVSLRRRALHRQVAEALEQAANADPDTVAHHYQAAGDGRAFDWLVRAGERAENAFAWPMAAARYTSALELRGENAKRALLLYRIGFLLRYTDTACSQAHQEDALRLAQASGNRAVESVAWFDLNLLRFWDGEIAAGMAGMQAACDLFDELNPVEQASVIGRPGIVPDGPLVNSNRGVLLHMLCHVLPANEVYAMARDFIASLPDDAASRLATSHTRWIDAYWVMGETAAALGELDESQAYFERVEEEFERIGEVFMVAAAFNRHIHELELPYRADDPTTRIRLAARQIALKTGSLQQDDPSDDVDSQYPIGMLFIEGQWAALLETFTGRRGHAFVVPILQPRLERYLAEVYRLQGDLTRVWNLIDGRFPDGPATEPGQTYLVAAISLQRTAAMAALDAGDPSLAAQWIEAHDRWHSWGCVVWARAENQLLRAQHAHATGDLDAARMFAQQSLASARGPRQPLNLLAAARLLGELATAAGPYDEADQHLQAALALADACAAPFERALTLVALARLYLDTGNSTSARQWLIEARGICEPLSARPTLNRITDLEATIR